MNFRLLILWTILTGKGSSQKLKGQMVIKHNINAGAESIKENIMVIRAKFRPLLDKDSYLEDVGRLIDAVPKMLDNVEAMVSELENAFDILQNAGRKTKPE